MEIRRKAVNLICKYYENDAAMMAAAIEAELSDNDADLIGLLEKMAAELTDLAAKLKPAEPARAKKTRPVLPKIAKPRGRRPNPDRVMQDRLIHIAKRRSQLRGDGYFIDRDSMIAYYDENTIRRKKAEKFNKYGFIFKPISARLMKKVLEIKK